MAAVFVLAGVGLGSLLSPLARSALATLGSVVNISDRSSSAYFAKVESAESSQSAMVPASSCSGAVFDTVLWHIRAAGDGVTPLSFHFSTPLQWKPPPNTKACLFAKTSATAITTMNVVGFYGG